MDYSQATLGVRAPDGRLPRVTALGSLVALAQRPGPRECAVWRAVCLGQGNKQIARSLGISADTVHSHVSKLLDTLHLDNRTQLAVAGLLTGMVSAEDVVAMWHAAVSCHTRWPREGEPCSPGASRG